MRSAVHTWSLVSHIATHYNESSTKRDPAVCGALTDLSLRSMLRKRGRRKGLAQEPSYNSGIWKFALRRRGHETMNEDAKGEKIGQMMKCITR